MVRTRTLQPHPRLYINPEAIHRLRTPATGWPALRAAEQQLVALAKDAAATTDYAWPRNTHNAHLIRAQRMQGRVVTLLVRYLQTGDRRFRDAVVRHVRVIGQWKYWSWIAWRKKDARPEEWFDLSYGENSATLAIAYDLLHGELSAAERRMFLEIACRRAIRPCLKQVCGGKKPIWWYGQKDTNWNAICAGGAAMLSLAVYEELPEARRLVPVLDKSIRIFMEHLKEVDGGWEEGLGYWNYGMRYGLMYLLSAERAWGRPHPMLTQPATRRSLRFPLDFSPNGVAAGFNDANGWRPLPIHLAAALRLGLTDVASALCREMDQDFGKQFNWPSAAETLLFYPRRRLPAVPPRRRVVEHYRGLDWSFMANRMPGPSLYCSVRGGSSAVPHGQRDIMSFNLVVGDEALIVNPASGAYLDTTFSPRREELFDLTPAAKNAILINGVGVEPQSAVKASVIRAGGLEGIRIEATGAMGRSYDRPAARFCGRAFFMLDGPALLIVDHVETGQVALIENRIQTWAAVKAGPPAADCGAAILSGKRQECRVQYAATRPAKLVICRPALTWPVEPSTMLRWATADLFDSVTFVTLINPGKSRLKLALDERGGRIIVRVAGADWRRTVMLTRQLRG